MDFTRTRLDYLVKHLRECVARGELTNPLPNTRQWSRSLGVSRTTLTSALRALEKDGIVKVHPRHGVRLRPARPSQVAQKLSPHRLVRALYYAPDYPDVETDLAVPLLALVERLHRRGIQLILERCNDARFRALSGRGQRPQEMLLLLSVPSRYQKLFGGWTKSALLAGSPAAGNALPYLTADLKTSVRHAALSLLRHGLATISLLVDQSGAPGIQEAIEIFQLTCAEWRPQQIRGQVVRVSLDVEELVSQLVQFVSGIAPPHGLIVVQPVSLEVTLAALLARGVKVPAQVEVIAVNSTPAEARSCPSVSHYPLPTEQLVKTLTDAAVHYFESGSLPPLRKSIIVAQIKSVRTR